MASIHSLPCSSLACAGRERFHSALSPALEGRGGTFGPPDRERTPRRCRNTDSSTAGRVGLKAREQQPHLVLWDQGGPVTPGPRPAAQLRKDCRGHSLPSAWTGEKARVGRRRGRKETGRGENAEGKRGPRGTRETDTRTRESCSRPSPPTRQSPLCRARRLQPAHDST